MLDERAGGVRVILHCFSMPDRVEECLAHERLVVLVRRQRHLPEGRRRSARPRCGSRRPAAGRDRRAVSCPPSRCAASPTSRPTSSTPRGRSRSSAGSRTRSSRRPSSATRRPCSDGERPSARQRELGQNFLVDRNILDVIERLAELGRRRRGARGRRRSGVLSERLAPSVGHVHVVEVDRASRAALHEVLAPFDNVTLHIADALELDLSGLDPAPTKVVANLPYGVAATVILRTIDELPAVASWVVMVQREVGERFAAGPGTSAYGAPSVLAQLACEVRVLRPISRTVFRPVPNVDSVLVGLRGAARRRPAAARARPRGVRASAQGAGGVAGARAGRRPGDPRAGAGRARGARPPARRARRAPVARRVPRARPEAARVGSRAGQGQPVPVPRADRGRRPPRAGDADRVGVAGR